MCATSLQQYNNSVGVCITLTSLRFQGVTNIKQVIIIMFSYRSFIELHTNLYLPWEKLHRESK
jgi:hypothetical protein